MAQTFKCPACGAPLEYTGGAATMRCSYCGQMALVPEALRPPPAPPSPSPASAANPLGNVGALAEIGRLVRDDRDFEAVRLYRETFGVGLQEAEDAVDAIKAGRPLTMTSVSVGQPQPTAPVIIDARGNRPLIGCFLTAILGIIIVSVLIPLAGGLGIAWLAVDGSNAPSISPSFPTIAISTPAPTASPSPAPTATPGFASVALAFGSQGIGAGQFEDARSIAVDGQGFIYAAEYQGGRVQRFDAAGNFVTQWTVDPDAPVRSIAADRQGVVYIVQGGKIARYDGASGQPLGTVGDAVGWFDFVTTTLDGGLLAFSYGGSGDIVRLSSAGEPTLTLTGAISGAGGDRESDVDLAVDGLGNIYALGTMSDAVFRFAPDGSFVDRWGSDGDGPGQFQSPQTLAVDGQGRVFVGDINGVLVFDNAGNFLDRFDVEDGGAFGMVFNDQNELFVAARTRMYKFVVNP